MSDKPFKVLLVDDEYNTRNLLKLCIDWQALNMEVIADATSGIEALSLIAELHPDIVLTDIEMPYMDGIVLSKQILEHYIDTYVIIITAHEQFSYAQQAISIGVSDFILKPINAEMITTTLQKLSEKITAKRKNLTQLEISYKYIKDNAIILRNQFLNNLINGNLSNIQLFNDLEIIKMFSLETCSHIQLSLINILFDPNKYTENEKQGILQNCITYIQETLSADRTLYTFIDINNYIVLLSNETEVYLPELSEHITAYFKSNLHTGVYCGISPIISCLEDIPIAYSYAKEALKLCYILDEDIVYKNHFEDSHSSYQMMDDNPLNHLILLIKAGLNKEAVEITCDLLHASLQKGMTDLSSIKYDAINILSQITSEVIKLGVPASSLNFLDLSYSYLINLKSYAELEKYVIHTILEFCRLMNGINKDRLNDTVSQIINHLENHYTNEDLSLTSIAKSFYINSSYLSRVFKKVTHKSFTEYLVDLRIQKAIQLLKLSNYKAYQLAQMVGIPDPNYFVKCFKKVTGVSLQEFKSR